MNKGIVRQFVLYSLVGVLNTAIHFGVFVVLYRWLGVAVLAASTIGYAAGLANSYLMNRQWTFSVAGGANWGELSKFIAVNLLALGLNLLTLRYLSGTLAWLPELAQVVAIAVSLMVNFAGNKWWAFRRPA